MIAFAKLLKKNICVYLAIFLVNMLKSFDIHIYLWPGREHILHAIAFQQDISSIDTNKIYGDYL